LGLAFHSLGAAASFVQAVQKSRVLHREKTLKNQILLADVSELFEAPRLLTQRFFINKFSAGPWFSLPNSLNSHGMPKGTGTFFPARPAHARRVFSLLQSSVSR
jgi:hypothetical protein